MYFATFQYMMGTVVRFLSQLYEEYSTYLNFIVLLYGMSLLWVHNNLRTAIRGLEKGMVQFAEEEGQTFNVKNIYKKLSKRWTDQNKGKYLFIPTKKDVWFEKVNSEDLLKILNINSDYVKMALHKKLGKPERSKFSKYKYIAWDKYRHGLVRGLRKRFIDPKEVRERLEKRKENK